MAAQRAYIGAEKYRSLSVSEKVILLLVPGKQYISNADIRHYLPQLHSVDVGHILSKLRDAGYLESKGRSNAMKYTLSAPLAAFMQSAQSAESAENNIESSVLNGGSSVLNSEKPA